jgi:hypothetical protein
MKLYPTKSGLARLYLLLPIATAGSRLVQADGIPEPSLILYGVISDTSAGGNRVTYGPLTWTLQPSGGGPSVTAHGVLTNINDQFSYVLQIPCDTQIPGIPVSTGVLTLATSPILYNRAQVTVSGLTASFVNTALTNTILTSTDRGRIERIDLTVNLNSSGLLPDAWQIQYFGHTGIDPNADPDHDGMSNWAEYRAGTNPTDPQSRFTILRVSPSLPGSVIQWSSVQGKFYALQGSTNLLAGFADLQIHIPATEPINSIQDVSSLRTGPYFYRIRVE